MNTYHENVHKTIYMDFGDRLQCFPVMEVALKYIHSC